MIWWYKDVFIERRYVRELEHHSVSSSIRARMVKKSFLNLINKVQLSVGKHRQKQKVRQSYETLSKLNDHYLTDIGLRRNDLNSIAKANYPGLYQQNEIANPRRREFKVIEVTNSRPLSKENSESPPNYYKKAA